MRRVFISHASQDREIASRIADDISRGGHKVFTDRQLVPGDNWEQRLSKELHQSSHVILLLSSNYVNSKLVKQELESALIAEFEGQLKLVPILIADTRIPSVILDRKIVDMRGNYEDGIQIVLSSLKAKRKTTRLERDARFDIGSFILAISMSLLAATTSSFIADIAKYNIFNFLITLSAVVTITLAVTVGWVFIRRRRTSPHILILGTIENIYLNAIDESNLNPIQLLEDTRD